jgi:hypothetical protein
LRKKGCNFIKELSNLLQVDNCLSSVLGQEVELTDEFRRNYETWLNKEVYSMDIHWDLLLEQQDTDAAI